MDNYNYLIDRFFLTSYLSEDIDELHEAFSDLEAKGNITINDISDFLVHMEGCEINDILRMSYLDRLATLYRTTVAESAIEADNLFLEYAGSASHNRILIELMTQMEKVLAEYYDYALGAVKILNNMEAILANAAKQKSPDAKQAALKVKAEFKKLKDHYNANGGLFQTRLATFNKLKKICNKFDIKFSDIAMVEKKAFDKKLSAAYDKIMHNKDFLHWLPTSPKHTTPAIENINDAMDTLVIDDRNAVTTMISSYIQPAYNYLYESLMGNIGIINYLRYKLHLEKEDGIFYKAINRIFRSKKKSAE